MENVNVLLYPEVTDGQGGPSNVVEISVPEVEEARDSV